MENPKGPPPGCDGVRTGSPASPRYPPALPLSIAWISFLGHGGYLQPVLLEKSGAGQARLIWRPGRFIYPLDFVSEMYKVAHPQRECHRIEVEGMDGRRYSTKQRNSGRVRQKGSMVTDT